MRALCFTVDLDRDVNLPIEGQIPAGSIDRGAGTAPRFVSTDRGIAVLADLLDEIGMKATFFAEGRTAEKAGNFPSLSGHEIGVHGYDHEDLSSCIDGDHCREILSHAKDTIQDLAGREPVSFRAPYMKLPQNAVADLIDLGFRYDSSTYVDMAPSILPYDAGGVIEVPVPEGIDKAGKKISAYLWPMHEGKRKPQDYLDLASQLEEGVLVLATHTWHMSETRATGMMSESAERSNSDNVRAVLEGIIDMGIRPMTVAAAARLYR